MSIQFGTEEVSQQWRDGLGILPPHMREGVRLYIEYGVLGGDFQCLIMANDFVHAYQVADDVNGECLPDWAVFLARYAPLACWGSPEKVKLWSQKGGMNGGD